MQAETNKTKSMKRSATRPHQPRRHISTRYRAIDILLTQQNKHTMPAKILATITTYVSRTMFAARCYAH